MTIKILFNMTFSILFAIICIILFGAFWIKVSTFYMHLIDSDNNIKGVSNYVIFGDINPKLNFK